MKHPPTTSHNYLPLAMKASEMLPQGEYYEAEVVHDDWCDFLNKKGFCNCEPHIYVRRPVEPARG